MQTPYFDMYNFDNSLSLCKNECIELRITFNYTKKDTMLIQSLEFKNEVITITFRQLTVKYNKYY